MPDSDDDEKAVELCTGCQSEVVDGHSVRCARGDCLFHPECVPCGRLHDEPPAPAVYGMPRAAVATAMRAAIANAKRVPPARAMCMGAFDRPGKRPIDRTRPGTNPTLLAKDLRTTCVAAEREVFQWESTLVLEGHSPVDAFAFLMYATRLRDTAASMDTAAAHLEYLRVMLHIVEGIGGSPVATTPPVFAVRPAAGAFRGLSCTCVWAGVVARAHSCATRLFREVVGALRAPTKYPPLLPAGECAAPERVWADAERTLSFLLRLLRPHDGAHDQWVDFAEAVRRTPALACCGATATRACVVALRSVVVVWDAWSRPAEWAQLEPGARAATCANWLRALHPIATWSAAAAGECAVVEMPRVSRLYAQIRAVRDECLAEFWTAAGDHGLAHFALRRVLATTPSDKHTQHPAWADLSAAVTRATRAPGAFTGLHGTVPGAMPHVRVYDSGFATTVVPLTGFPNVGLPLTVVNGPAEAARTADASYGAHTTLLAVPARLVPRPQPPIDAPAITVRCL